MTTATEINPLPFFDTIRTKQQFDECRYALTWYQALLVDHPDKADELVPRITELEKMIGETCTENLIETPYPEPGDFLQR